MNEAGRLQFPQTVAEAVKTRDGRNLEEILGDGDANTFSRLSGQVSVKRNLVTSASIVAGKKVLTDYAVRGQIDDDATMSYITVSVVAGRIYNIRYSDLLTAVDSIVYENSNGLALSVDYGASMFTVPATAVVAILNIKNCDMPDTELIAVYERDKDYNKMNVLTRMVDDVFGTVKDWNVFVLGDSITAGAWYGKFERETAFRNCRRYAQGGWTLAPDADDAPSSSATFRSVWTLLRDRCWPDVNVDEKNLFFIDAGFNDRNDNNLGSVSVATDWSVSFEDKITADPFDADVCTIAGAVRLYAEFIQRRCSNAVIVFGLPLRAGGASAANAKAVNDLLAPISSTIRSVAEAMGCPVIDKGALVGPNPYFNIGANSKDLYAGDGYYVHPMTPFAMKIAGLVKTELYNILRHRC
jgi:hypothetical protein